MKWLNQISIKVKVMLPICILGIVILLASISSLVNSKRLLQAGVVISQDCSKSIELLMDMSSELESMGKNMYGHCDAENSISKESFATTIHEKLESMDSYFKQYKKQKKTAREKEYFGALHWVLWLLIYSLQKALHSLSCRSHSSLTLSLWRLPVQNVFLR